MKNVKLSLLILFQFILVVFQIPSTNSLSTQAFTSNSLSTSSSLMNLKQQIEEKQKFLQMIMQQQGKINTNINNYDQNHEKTSVENHIQHSSEGVYNKKNISDLNQEINSSNTLKENENNSNNNEYNKSNAIINNTDSQLSEIKPLLKSIVDMQYYTYQLIKKMNTSFDEVKSEIDVIKNSITNERLKSRNSDELFIETEDSGFLSNNKDKLGSVKIKLNKNEKLIDP